MIDFAKHGIDTPSGRTSGQYKTKCPNCISNRSNKRDRSLSVDLATGLFNCHYCGWTGCAAGSDKHWSDKIFVPKVAPKPKPQPSYIDAEILKKSLKRYDENHFAQWLAGIVGNDAANEAIGRYFVGTSSKRWDGATVFWYIDLSRQIRSGKVMQYDRQTGKRIREPYSKIDWAHSEKLLNLRDFTLVLCFFGEHLMIDNTKPIAVVEAEKTAIIASIYMPDMIWLACGGADGLGGKYGLSDKCSVLKNRNVVLFPDAKKFEAWSEKAQQLSKICTASVSTLIEQYATEHEKQEGLDIADYLIRFAPSDFVKQQPPAPDVVKPDAPCVVTVAPVAPLDNKTVTAAITERKTPPSNPIVAAMCAKNPALLRLIQMFDCEIIDAYTDCRLLTSEELRQLARQIPEHDAFAPEELCNMLNIEIHDVAVMIDDKEILLCPRRELYYKQGSTPF